jgi:hypothetical protein
MMELVDWADMVPHMAAMAVKRVVEKPAQTIGTNSKVTEQVLDPSSA